MGVSDGSGLGKGAGSVSRCVQPVINRKTKAIGREIAQIHLPSSSSKASYLGEEVAEDPLMATIIDLVASFGHLLAVDPHIGEPSSAPEYPLRQGGIELKVELHPPHRQISVAEDLNRAQIGGSQIQSAGGQLRDLIAMPEEGVELRADISKERVGEASRGQGDLVPSYFPRPSLNLPSQPIGKQLVAQADPKYRHAFLDGQKHSISLRLEKGGLELLWRVLSSAQYQGVIAHQVWDRLALIDPDGDRRNPVLGQRTIQDQNARGTML
jgi:hypothetical protein